MSADTQSLACTYAALMLHDAGVPVTAENISAAVEAAGVEVRATLPILFSRFLQKKSIGELMASAAAVAPSAGAAAPAGGAASAPAAAAPAAGGKKEAKKVESESDDDLGFGLFD